MSERTQAIREALKETSRKREAARKRRREKRGREKPWQILEEEWLKAMRARGIAKPTPWAAKERKLARALIKEVELEPAIEMVHRFVERWDKEGEPSFGYLWVARDSFKDNGRSRSRRDAEYDAEAAKHAPKVGW